MGSGGVAIAALPTVICLKVPFSDSLGGILANLYHWTHPNVPEEEIPYWYKRPILGEVWHLIRKFICQNIAPNCVLTPVRIGLYRMCGFKIGKGCFIGMKCYFDDLCVDKIVVGDNVTISYGVYFLTSSMRHPN